MQNRMNNNGCLIYVLALVMVSTILYFPSLLHSMTGSSLEYMQVLLMFLIPIRVKWLGILEAVMLAYDAVVSPYYVRIAIFASLLNFLIFWLRSRNLRRLSPKEIQRRAAYKKSAQRGEAQRTHTVIDAQNAFRKMQYRHRCCICGKTELDNPDEEFRFCSKCAGNREYCSEHLYTHVHVTSENEGGQGES